MKCNRPRKPLSMMCMLIVALMMVVSASSRTAYSHNSRSTEDTVRIKRAKFFSIPRADKVAVWEAERARQRGKWELRRHKLASGGFYVRPIELSSDTMLEFPFKVRKPISIMVYPLWWRHGERLPARRFPYPLERKPGPDAIATWRKNLLFFTAPANGRIGVFDITAKRVIKAVDIGGYITDLVVDGEFDKVYIADAIGNRVVVLDPRHLRVSNEIKVPACPWSLALSDGILYVACRDGRAVVAIDSLFERVIAQAQLPMPALHVEVHGERVIVWLEPRVFDVAKLQTIKPEREQYAFGRRTGAEYGPRRKPGWKRFYCAGAHTIRIETLTEKGWTRKLLDVKQVTGAPKSVTQLPQPLRDTPGPDALCIYGSRLFFTSPSTGRVGVIDIAKERVERALDIGGYLSDIVADPLRGRVYVADAIGNRIVTIDAQQLKVLNSIQVPALPVALEMFTPPGFLRGCAPMLFAGCWRAKSVIGIDPAQSKITWQSNLPIEPRYLCVVTPPNPGWWPLIPIDRIQLEALRTRLAVASMPIAFTKRELKFVEPAHVAPRFGRRSEVIQELGGGARRVIGVDNYHTIRVALYDGQGRMLSEDWVDVTNVTDPQLRSEPQPLTPLDKPGTVTIALDDGPEYHWRREIWMTPKQGILLVNETDEFWRWNAPVFSLPAGEHVIRVRAYSGYAQLDGLRIRRTLKGRLRMRIYGHQPMEMLPMRYRSVFYYDEPVELRVELKNLLPISQTVRMSYTVTNYAQEVVATGKRTVVIEPDGSRVETIPLRLYQNGIFALNVKLASQYGDMVDTHYFMRLPRLVRPRMLLRREHIPKVEQRIAKYERLFERYTQWLRRQCDKPGFLPAGITRATFVPKLPEKQRKLSQGGQWRRYELAWRMIAVEFAAMFARDPELRQFFTERVRELLKDGRTDYYCAFHHHGPFFPGAVAALFDMSAATLGDSREIQRLRDFFRNYIGDMNVFPWTLAALEEPLTVRERAILWHIMIWLVNVERYFHTHQGVRGGRRWLNPRTGCHCPFAGYGYSFLYLRHFLDEPRFHERPLVRGFLTHSELVHPMRDNRGMLGPVGPRGEPLKWIASTLSKHPLEKFKYSWEQLIEKLNADDISAEEVDKLLQFAEEASTSRPMPFVVPLGLALGWYDPNMPAVRWDELPPTVIFDVEGDVVMRSGWSNNATEVYFTCGARDHVYRHQPTHLRIAKAGEFLLGTASSWGDDGNPAPGKSWGNVVVIEPSDWRERWGMNLMHPRAEEYPIIMRFSDHTFRYIGRDRRLVRYAPAEGGYGGGLDMHGHTESVFLKEGEIVAYETWPQFDYVAGDATNSWLPEHAEAVYRQVVFIRPNVIVVYDRVVLGERAERAFWLAATGEQLQVRGGRFDVRSGDAVMHGYVLLPERIEMRTFELSKSNKYNTPPPFTINWRLFDGRTQHQKVIEIHPASPSKRVEFLVVMCVGVKDAVDIQPQLLLDERFAGAQFTYEGNQIRLRFYRTGMVGGDISISNGGKRFKHTFVQRVDDSYRHWKDDPRFKMWMTEPRFEFIIPANDRKRFGRKR